jgi:hypothetical protein
LVVVVSFVVVSFVLVGSFVVVVSLVVELFVVDGFVVVAFVVEDGFDVGTLTAGSVGPTTFAVGLRVRVLRSGVIGFVVVATTPPGESSPGVCPAPASNPATRPLPSPGTETMPTPVWDNPRPTTAMNATHAAANAAAPRRISRRRRPESSTNTCAGTAWTGASDNVIVNFPSDENHLPVL